MLLLRLNAGDVAAASMICSSKSALQSVIDVIFLVKVIDVILFLIICDEPPALLRLLLTHMEYIDRQRNRARY